MADTVVNEIARDIKDSKALLGDDKVREDIFNLRNKFKETLGLDIPEETIVEIAALFSLPDDKFEDISTVFLSTFEQSLNTNQSRIEMSRTLNIMNVKAEEMVSLNKEWNNIIDTQLIDEFSKPKRTFLKRLFNIFTNMIMDSEGISKRIIRVSLKMDEGAIKPTYANLGDAGADVSSIEEVTIEPGETKLIHTGLYMEIPRGYEVQVRPRSGLSLKSKIRIANAPGTIDSGYRDEICVICENTDSKIKDITSHYNDNGELVIDSIVYGSPITIEKGQRIAQFVLSEVPTIDFMEVEEISKNEDRGGGFGSSGD